MALLALRKGEYDRARALLDRSQALGQEVAAVHRLRSALFRSGNQPDRGFAELEAAARADPLNPKSFYFWGRPYAGPVDCRKLLNGCGKPSPGRMILWRKTSTPSSSDWSKLT